MSRLESGIISLKPEKNGLNDIILRAVKSVYSKAKAKDITDNGIGIPEEEQAQIFNRFYRGKYSSRVDGVGIGLCLTRDIMTKQKGYIKVISNETGTTFSLFLRLYVEE